MVALGPDDAEERAEWQTALTRVVDSRAFCLGTEVNELEARVAEQLEVHAAIGVSNGTDAIRLCLQAVGVGVGDEVIVPSFSFFATASCVAHLGARPVFVDVDPGTLNLNVGAVAAAVTDKTKAVLPAHLYGQTCPLDELRKVCEAHSLALVEDAAQCFGVRYQGVSAGGWGAAGTFSFYPTKNLGAPGDAGMIVTNSEEQAHALRSLRVHGDGGGYQHQALGWNARMDGFQAAILKIRLDRLPHIQAARERNALQYLESFTGELGQKVQPLERCPGSDHGWHQFIVRVTDRDAVRSKLSEQGIATGIYYPTPLPALPAFNYLGHKPGEFPVAEEACREIMALPIHHRLGESEIERVVQALARTLQVNQ